MSQSIIQTIKQNCRRCYTCVRDCPAKAIRIEDGQAFVVEERCLACGNCTMVCSQNAKAYVSGVETTTALLDGPARTAALLAPSFPADFGADAGALVAALRKAGFDYVVEVAYGADLVSAAYREYLASHPNGLHVATACPAVVEFVRKYNPELTDHLVPIVSPMVATARAVKELHGDDVVCVFIGPCVSKKLEARDPEVAGAIDEVLTFEEMQRLLEHRGAGPVPTPTDGYEICIPLWSQAGQSVFDPPLASRGRVFPLIGGLLDSAGLEHGLVDPDVLLLSGNDETVEVLGKLRRQDVAKTLFVEALMCRGCHAGPGMKAQELGLTRKQRIGRYISRRPPAPPYDGEQPVSLSRGFSSDDRRHKEPTEEEIRDVLAHTNKLFPEDELDCGACGYPTCRDKAIAVCRGMAEEAMCLPFMIEQAERVCHELNVPWQDLRDVHRHLLNSEKLASMGQMAAGVAHELNNPLSTILLYTHILRTKLTDRDDLSHDLDLVATESQRCKGIIGNLLDFARQSRVDLKPTQVGQLLTQAADAARPSIAAGSGIQLEVEAPDGLTADLDRDQMTQVLANLIKNGLEALDGRGGTVRVTADATDQDQLRIVVSDDGPGVPEEARDKVFQPFFTTKTLSKGTGLGLPISYGIVKMHRGRIWFDSEPGCTAFHIELPLHQPAAGRSIINDDAACDPVR